MTKTCPHLNCLVKHGDMPCRCDMSSNCAICRDEFDPNPAESVKEIINNSLITGDISGRHLILLGGKKDRKWDGGGYEENEYRFLDEYIANLISQALAKQKEAIVEELREDKIEDVAEDINSFARGYDEGWNYAVDELNSKLDNL